jgi:hypothetical protein
MSLFPSSVFVKWEIKQLLLPMVLIGAVARMRDFISIDIQSIKPFNWADLNFVFTGLNLE